MKVDRELREEEDAERAWTADDVASSRVEDEGAADASAFGCAPAGSDADLRERAVRDRLAQEKSPT